MAASNNAPQSLFYGFYFFYFGGQALVRLEAAAMKA